jgi:hypothetical protein
MAPATTYAYWLALKMLLRWLGKAGAPLAPWSPERRE